MIDKLKHIVLPKIGLRKVKSVLALILAFFLWQLVRLISPVSLDIHPLFGYIYAIIEIRETVEKTKQFGALRIKATLIGLAVGIAILPLSVLCANNLGNIATMFIDLALICIAVLASLWLAEFFKCKNFCGIAAIITVICLMRDRNADVSIYFYAVMRVFQTILGVFAAWFINRFVTLPHFHKNEETSPARNDAQNDK